MPTLTDLPSRSPGPEAAEQPGPRYRALSGWSIMSLILGVLSAVVVFDWFLAVIPCAGIAAGWLARRRIRKNPEESAGLAFAWTGLVLSIFFWVLGYGWLLLGPSGYIREVPFGYQRVEYEDLQPDPSIKDQQVPDAAWQLQERKVFVKGYMAPTRQQTHLKRFILCPAIPSCPFCPANPKATEMILITLNGDLEAEYTTHLVRLGGKFTIDPESRIGIPYALEADYLR